MSDLIYDIGSHKGEDSHFYLAKGFRVVAVDADPRMCAAAAERLRAYVESGQLQVVCAAIADAPGRRPFFTSSKSEWSTTVRQWDEQNSLRGSTSVETSVDAITLAQLVGTYGEPFYMKIDIEGMDRAVLASLERTSAQPKYISIESAFPRDASFKNIKREFHALARLGYDRFKIVPQHEVEDQVPPCPASAGEYVSFRFAAGSSGLFGEEAPGSWLPQRAALQAFRSIFRKSWPALLLYRLTGRLPDIGWYDIHAKHSRE